MILPNNLIERHLELHKKYDCVGCYDRVDVKEFKVKEVLSLYTYNCSFSRKVLNKIGYFDERFTFAAEDIEFFSRAKLNGFSVVKDFQTPVIHLHEKKFIDELKVNFYHGTQLGKLIRITPQGKLYSKWFLVFPIYIIKIIFSAGMNFLKEILMGLSELTGKILGYLKWVK